ncbi:SDR family NAD(P)-dependent oxidoreductase [Fluviibacterium sp. S390]|uniref:SDR family NAD(P)-dependent oxidoreductase n=1 Tax=Fluviibacterium sp. S390 TaxID=3415139 RepID=UPI003C7A6F20
MTRRALITGSAGFIGYHLCERLLAAGWQVTGYDALSDYYDVALKEARHARLARHPGFTPIIGRLEDMGALERAGAQAQPEVIVHLAAQAGVRYSIENPRAYLETNITGSFNVMALALEHKVDHLLMASTSSVYGANTKMPYAETDKVDTQMSFYAATKKADEAMAHAWAHIHGLPITLFRFFTVYGPWGRPDMAYFKFTRSILNGDPIDVYNNGEMWRDFTYVEDLVRGIELLIDAKPVRPAAPEDIADGDSLSPVAPWRVVNIGNSEQVRLMDFIGALEDALGQKANCNFMEMQPGDVPATWAEASLLKRLTGYAPKTDMRDGMQRFVDWYRDYYKV